MQQNLSKIPATVVTGFLGSGKTTLLTHLVKQANGKRIAIIVNEFGEMDIDADLLRSCSLEGCEDQTSASLKNGIYELANGCICCTVEEEFLPVMKQLVTRRNEIDHVIIETSGLALPKPLVQAFNWPEIQNYFTVDAVITVVDGPAVIKGQFADNPSDVIQQRLNDDNLNHDTSLHVLFEDQLGAADLIIVSKNDLLSKTEQQHVQVVVKDEIKSSVKIISVTQGEIAPEIIMGLQAATEKRMADFHSHHDHHHEKGKHHKHAHDDFDSIVITLNEIDSELLQQQLQALIRDHDIYRIKGFAAIHNKPMRQVIQVVGTRIDSYFDRLWQANEKRKTKLVFIGKNLNKNTIKKMCSPSLEIKNRLQIN